MTKKQQETLRNICFAIGQLIALYQDYEKENSMSVEELKEHYKSIAKTSIEMVRSAAEGKLLVDFGETMEWT